MAGADIAEMTPMTPWQAREFSELGHVATALLEDLPCATIAALNGYALGGGPRGSPRSPANLIYCVGECADGPARGEPAA